jgi:tetratricopeptide (TPR) repeat protein
MYFHRFGFLLPVHTSLYQHAYQHRITFYFAQYLTYCLFKAEHNQQEIPIRSGSKKVINCVMTVTLAKMHVHIELLRLYTKLFTHIYKYITMRSTANWYFLTLLISLTSFAALAQSRKLDSLKNVLATLPEDTNRVNTLIVICTQQEGMHTDSVFNTAQKALALSKKIGYKSGEAYVYNYLAFACQKQGKLLKAADYLLKSTEIFKSINKTGALPALYNNLAILYAIAGEEANAVKFSNKSIALYEASGDQIDVMTAVYNLGDFYARFGRDSLALVKLQAALKISEALNENSLRPAILLGIGKVYFNQKRYPEALSIEKKALSIEPGSGNPSARYEIYIQLGKIYLALGDARQALAAAQTGLALALQADDRHYIAEGYDLSSRVNAMLHNFEKAYSDHLNFTTLNDSLRNADNLIAIEKLNYKHELDKKESEIILLNQKYDADTFKRNVFIVALIILLLIGFLLYNRFRLITNKNLAMKKKELDLYLKRLIEKSDALAQINTELESLRANVSEDTTQAEKLDKVLQINILTEEDWGNFKKAFEDIYPGFFSQLRYLYPKLTMAELRLSALIKVNLNAKEIASILGISPESVKTARYRLKKKYQLADDDTLEDFINKLTSKHRPLSKPTIAE